MWDANVTVEALTQSVDSSIITLKPGETAHVQIKRTGVVTDLILAQIYGILENTPGERDVVPFYVFGMRSTETSLSFIMRGVWGFVVNILNGQVPPTGSITADLRYKKDGVDIG